MPGSADSRTCNRGEPPLTKPHPEVEAKIASKLGNMLLVRKTLETDWAWRVAAHTARKGLTDDEILSLIHI